jgi:hypothetical protein
MFSKKQSKNCLFQGNTADMLNVDVSTAHAEKKSQFAGQMADGDYDKQAYSRAMKGKFTTTTQQGCNGTGGQASRTRGDPNRRTARFCDNPVVSSTTFNTTDEPNKVKSASNNRAHNNPVVEPMRGILKIHGHNCTEEPVEVIKALKVLRFRPRRDPVTEYLAYDPKLPPNKVCRIGKLPSNNLTTRPIRGILKVGIGTTIYQEPTYVGPPMKRKDKRRSVWSALKSLCCWC